MGDPLAEKLDRIPLVRWLVKLLKGIRLKAFEGMSMFDLTVLYVRGIVRGTLSIRASAIAFSLFMALFPLLIFLITLLPYLIPYVNIGEGNLEDQFLHFLETLLPRASGDYFNEIFLQLREQKTGGWLSYSFLISIFLMTNGVNAIFGGFESSYHIEFTRNFFRQYAYALMVGMILSILLILGAVTYISFEFFVAASLVDLTPDGTQQLFWIRFGQAISFIVLSYLTTAVLYYFGTMEGKKAKFFSYGALMTTLLILFNSYLFGVYIERFARYNEIYGALGGLLILMVYIWLNSNILLLGFELNATLAFLHKNVEKSEDDEDLEEAFSSSTRNSGIGSETKE
ncbi:YihY/virulence factor BrkB family protein [Robiginitalea aurantiaca]|uniref:YihY/virulence factor BrkB family protein n=1 Tax=Robiginitalea aurantiaca TaxID=3056915 RepID=A0ABT7WCA2_9FLAO|nr:YihY/virulence factor BrkB family protein [Robiginitalea aurantiaca]MDM9630533.1 YihY/virulence factor BrkB family protein [Robiginitalea aurantiaca]